MWELTDWTRNLKNYERRKKRTVARGSEEVRYEYRGKFQEGIFNNRGGSINEQC